MRKFAAEGCDIAINYVNSHDAAAKLAEEMISQHGIKAVVIQADVSKQSECKTLVRKAIDELGGLDIIISNAGNTKFGKFEDLNALSAEDWDYTWHNLVMANLWLLQEAESTFKSNADGGCFLIMSSLAGLITMGSSLAYSVCRAAANHLTKCLAQTQGPKIRVNAVCPGFVETERTMEFGGEEGLKKYADMTVLKRNSTTEEVADTFVCVYA